MDLLVCGMRALRMIEPAAEGQRSNHRAAASLATSTQVEVETGACSVCGAARTLDRASRARPEAPVPARRARERANKYFAGDHFPTGLSLWSLQASISSDADFICPLEVVAGGLATVPGTAGRVCLLFRGDSISASTCLQDGVAVFPECPSKGEMIAKLRRIFTEL